MRTILIDPEKRTFTEIQLENDDYRKIQATLCCRSFTTGAHLSGSIEEGFDAIQPPRTHDLGFGFRSTPLAIRHPHILSAALDSRWESTRKVLDVTCASASRNWQSASRSLNASSVVLKAHKDAAGLVITRSKFSRSNSKPRSSTVRRRSHEHPNHRCRTSARCHGAARPPCRTLRRIARPTRR